MSAAGGYARAAKMTPEERSRAASAAANARWNAGSVRVKKLSRVQAMDLLRAKIAAQIRAVESLHEDVLKWLREGDYVRAAESATRAQMIFNQTTGDLERATGVPWQTLGLEDEEP